MHLTHATQPKIRRVIAALSVLATVISLGFALMPAPAVAGPQTATVVRKSIEYTTVTGGQVVPKQSTDVAFASGAGLSASSGSRRVKSVFVKVGDVISEGDALVELDGDDVEERLDAARSGLSAAQESLKQAQEMARLQAAQAAKLSSAAAEASAGAAQGQADTQAAISSCAAKINAVAATAAGETAAVMASPPPGLPPVPTYQQLLPYLPNTQAAVSAAIACLSSIASASGQAGAQGATAKLLEQQAAGLRSGGSATSAASSRVEAARKQVRQAERSKKALIIHAPYDAVVTSVNVTEGSLLPQGVGAVGVRTRNLEARADLVEGDLIAVKPGAQASVKVGSAAMEISTTVSSLPKDPLKAIAGPAIYPVYLPLPDSNSLRAGQTVRVKITVPGKDNVLVVPTSAIGGRGADTYITVMTEKGEENRKVVPGIINDAESEVISGINEGETIRRIAR